MDVKREGVPVLPPPSKHIPAGDGWVGGGAPEKERCKRTCTPTDRSSIVRPEKSGSGPGLVLVAHCTLLPGQSLGRRLAFLVVVGNGRILSACL